jgi:hypothetical protein
MLALHPETLRLSGKAVGSRGSGKTWLAAYLLFRQLKRGVGGYVLDPMSKVTEYLFQMIAADPQAKQLWQRIIYVPVGGMRIAPPMDAVETASLTQDDVNRLTWVVPTPFLYRRSPFESLQDQTARVTGLWERLFPEQRNAPIQGLPSIMQETDACGMLLAAMGKQLVPDASLMLRAPEVWEGEIAQVLTAHPEELAPAATLLRHYADPKFRPSDKRSETMSFLRLIERYETNPRLRAQYGATQWGVDFHAAEQGQVLLFDCSGLAAAERRLALTWLFTRCMEHFDARGARRDQIAFCLDDLHHLVKDANPFIEEDLKHLIAVIGRNHSISSFFTYQEVTQPPEELRLTMDMVGYSFYAGSADPDAARRLAQLLDDFDPKWIKDRRTAIVQTPQDDQGTITWWEEEVNLYYTALEQEMIHAITHRTRPGLTFAVAMAAKEGDAARYRGTITIKPLIARHRFVASIVTQAKRRLVQRDGRRVSDVLAEIAVRQPHHSVPAGDAGRPPGAAPHPPRRADDPPFQTRVRGPRSAAS